MILNANVAALGAAAFLAACSSHVLELAPDKPETPWQIPASARAIAAADSAANASSSEDGSTSSPASSPAAPARSVPAGDSGWQAVAVATGPQRSPVRIDPNRRYNLAELIDLAQRSNPETREAWERARQAALSVGLIDATYAPQISAEAIGGFQHTPLPIPTTLVPQGFFTADTRELLPTLAIKWLLFDFGRRDGLETAARENSFAANVAFTGAHQRLIFSVSRDYFTLSAARGRLRVADQALKDAYIVEDAVEARRRNGRATTVELAQAKRQTAQARFNLERATGAEHAAYAALIDSMGLAPGASLQVADGSEQKLPTVPDAKIDQLVFDALANRPDVIAALGKVRAAQATLQSAQAAYYPTVAVVGEAYQNFGALSVQGSKYFTVNEPGGNILLKLSVPLYDGGARSTRIAIAESEVASARAALDQSRIAAVKQVTDAYDALKTGLAEYAAAVTLRAAAWTAYDAALDAYRHGLGTYTDLVNTETALTEADSELVTAHATALTAAAALAFATGSITSTNDGR